MKRMDIVWVELEKKGSIQGGYRPCLIICNNAACAYSPTLIVAPITSSNKKHIPTHMYLNNVLSKDSTILFEQMITVNKEQISSKITELPRNLIRKAEEKIMISLGLNLAYA